MTSYEILAVALAVPAAILTAIFAWWRCWSADRMLRLEMLKEATKLAAVEDTKRSYMERVAGIFILTRLVDQQFWISRLLRRRGEYDEVVGILVGIFLKYRRLVFPHNAPAGHKENQLDYRSLEYRLIRDWINNRAPRRISSSIAFHEEHPFKMCNGKLEANEHSSDFAEWKDATGESPY